MMRAIHKATGAVSTRLRLMVRWGVLRLVRATMQTQELQVSVYDGETHDRVKHALPYGFSAHPLPGSEVVLVFPGGVSSTPIALVVGGRAHRPTDLQRGEVAIYDDKGQSVELRTDRIVVRSPTRVTIECPDVHLGEEDGPRVARIGDRVQVGSGSSAGLWPIVEGSTIVRAGG
ncbi:phage baseplate assembly protein V [Roseospira navarrensis]|uniref:Phage baseplate assembly protein V n=1 Tax=Roseospira navarrensis TaxID=140058 RepID=A0A7X1ZFU6_9PROT|nr:phage baseplate assembly protein V [Roseospira navarrensis]MQX36811.1 phage baseplate assembly protein V [Roseospira navarrensis]